jgi:hypothetical protein
MFLLHYIIPLLIFQFYKNYNMLYGLLLGNLIDLDHIYYRIIGKVGWFESICPGKSGECSYNLYPLHTLVNFNAIALLIFLLAFSLFIFNKNKIANLLGWFFFGVFLHIILDITAYLTGFGI